MLDVFNCISRLPDLRFIAGRIGYTAGTPAITAYSGDSLSDLAQITITDTGTGDCTFTITNFRGRNGTAVAYSNPTTLGYTCNPQPPTYAAGTDTLTVEFLIGNTSSAAADNDFNFLILGL